MQSPPRTPAEDDRQRRFIALYSRDSDRLRAFLLFLLRDRTLADDVLQEVAITLWERFDDYDASRPFLPWARGIARLKALRAADRRRRDLPTLAPEAIDAVEAALDREAPASAEATALDRCLERLPDAARRLLRLRYIEELALDAVATRMGSSLTAVTKALSRLRVRLADCMRERLAREDA